MLFSKIASGCNLSPGGRFSLQEEQRKGVKWGRELKMGETQQDWVCEEKGLAGKAQWMVEAAHRLGRGQPHQEGQLV